MCISIHNDSCYTGFFRSWASVIIWFQGWGYSTCSLLGLWCWKLDAPSSCSWHDPACGSSRWGFLCHIQLIVSLKKLWPSHLHSIRGSLHHINTHLSHGRISPSIYLTLTSWTSVSSNVANTRILEDAPNACVSTPSHKQNFQDFLVQRRGCYK